MERWGDRGWHSTARGNSPEKKQQTSREQSPDRSRSPLFSVVIIGDPRRTRTYNHLIKESDESCSTVVHRRPPSSNMSHFFGGFLVYHPSTSASVRRRALAKMSKKMSNGQNVQPRRVGLAPLSDYRFPSLHVSRVFFLVPTSATTVLTVLAVGETPTPPTAGSTTA